jgi:transcriptional regulator with XRE-family HTH domain
MNRLREIRVVKRITQFQLRLSTGIHRSKISLIENGLVEAREDEKDKLAKALDVKVEEIWSLADDKETIEENKKD